MNKPLDISVDLRSLFVQLGIGPNDLILVHYHPILDELLLGPAQLIDELSKYLNEGTLCSYQVMNSYVKAEVADLALRDRFIKIQDVFKTKRYLKAQYHPVLLAMDRLQGRLFHENEMVVFCSWGHDSRYLNSLVGHDFLFGQDSPFRGLYDLKAKILFFNEDYPALHELKYGYVFDSQQPIQKVATRFDGKASDYLDYLEEPEKYRWAIEKTEKKKTIVSGSMVATVVDFQQAAVNLMTL